MDLECLPEERLCVRHGRDCAVRQVYHKLRWVSRRRIRLVHHRMRRPGRGWQRDNAQAMLAGLSELHSGRFERAWKATLPQAA